VDYGDATTIAVGSASIDLVDDELQTPITSRSQLPDGTVETCELPGEHQLAARESSDEACYREAMTWLRERSQTWEPGGHALESCGGPVMRLLHMKAAARNSRKPPDSSSFAAGQ